MTLHELYCVKKLGGAKKTTRVMVGMTPPGVAMLLCTLLVVLFAGAASANSMPAAAHPGFDSGLCEVPSLRGSRRIVDISHALRPDLPSWEEEGGIGEVLQLVASMRNGSLANQSQLSRLGVHTGTHVDAPSHIFQEYYDLGDHVHTLDLHKLNGLALIVDAPRHSNLTAESMLALKIPRGVERVIFRTLNTDRRLMWKRQFDTSYVGFTTDGAQWLKDNTDIKLIGVDYLSVASYDHLIPAHKVFLQEKDIVLVEGLNLDDVETGLYDLHCLPLQVLNSDGAPIRCIVEK